jgi:hypothetical protein
VGGMLYVVFFYFLPLLLPGPRVYPNTHVT